jgi:hypothetical protein
LVVLSVLLILGGLTLLLPSSSLVSQIASATSSGSAPAGALAASRTSGTDATTTIESMVGFGMIGVGLVLEVLSLFTEVGMAVPSGGSPSDEKAGAQA